MRIDEYIDGLRTRLKEAQSLLAERRGSDTFYSAEFDAITRELIDWWRNPPGSAGQGQRGLPL